MVQDKHLFCFGYGYTCHYLGDALMKQGWRVSGTTRDQDKRRALRALGVQAHLFDFDLPLPDPIYMLRDVTHLVISTPPADDGDPTFNLHAEDLMNFPNLEWVAYLSTISPYGDRGGQWVDETTIPRPTTKRGSRRLKAEEQWASLNKSGLPVHLFRLAGIYGPGRSALDSVRHGTARRIDKPGHVFSRIHVADIIQVLMASMAQPKPGEIYNICDDMPVPSHEVIECACRMLGIEPPPLIPFEVADLAPITQSFYADNKRVRNTKIKENLGVRLLYDTYRDGLKACLEAEALVEDFRTELS